MTAIAPWHERHLTQLLAVRPRPGEPIEAGLARIERAIGAWFAELSAAHAHGLHHRLSTASPDDALAEQFARLASDRRARLLAVLAILADAHRGVAPPPPRYLTS